MIIDQAKWFEENVKGKIKPHGIRTDIGNGRLILSLDGLVYDGQKYENLGEVLDVIKQKYLEDMK